MCEANESLTKASAYLSVALRHLAPSGN